MPFEDDPLDLAPRGPIAPGVADARSVGALLPGAVFRQVSPVGSALNALTTLSGIDQADDPTFNAWDEIKDTEYAQYASAFARARNRSQFSAIKGNIDREKSDERIMADAGGAGVVAALAAGMIDPTILLPGGSIYRSVKGGVSVMRTAGSAAAWGAAQGAASEAILQGTQITRRPEEWLTSIGSSAVLSGILGAGAGALLSKGERIAAERALDEARGGVMADIPMPKSGGAAVSDVRTNEMVGFGLNKIPGYTKMSPTMRVMSSGLQESRRVLGDLAVLALDTVDNRKGITAAFEGVPVEAEVMRLREQMLYNSLKEQDRLYNEYRFGAEGGSLVERGMNRVQGVLGQETGMLTVNQFREEVAKAMRRGDAHDTPQVQAAAQHIRKNVIEPLLKRAQDAELLPKDLKVKGAESWFMRMYNRDMIEANGPEFSSRIERWLGEQEAQKESIKARLESLNDQRSALVEKINRLEQQQETLAARTSQTEARLSERGMEAGAAGKRADVTQKRVDTIDEQIKDIRNFVTQMREEMTDPTVLAKLDEMEAEANALKKEAGPYSDAEIRAVTKEARAQTLAGDGARIADLVTGRQTPKAGRSFLNEFFELGIYDPGGEVRSVLGAAKPREPIPGLSRSDKKDAIRPGLLRSKRERNSLDDWGERLHDRYPEVFRERPTPNEVLDMIDEAAHGRNPAGWDEATGTAADRALVEYADDLSREIDRAGIPAPKNRDEFIAAMNRLVGDPPAVMDAINRKLEAISRSDDAARAVEALKADRAGGKSVIREALQEVGALDRQRVRSGATAREAGLADRRNTGRMGVLERRMSLEQEKQEFLAAVRADLQRATDDLQARIEEQIAGWEGNSTAEAKAALKAREKYVQEQSAAGKTPGDAGRLTGADDAVNRAVKRILGRQGRDESAIKELALEIKDRIISTPDGRMPYDIGSTRSGGFVESDPMQRSGPRGSLATRDFAIPDAMIEDFLINDSERMVRNFLDTFAPDVALHERFGSVDMTEQIKRILDEANAREARAPDEAARLAIRTQANNDIRDIAAMRDRIRHIYGADFNQKFRSLGRAANVMRMWNQMTLLGGAGISSFNDMTGAVFRWGMDAVTSGGLMPYIRSISSDEVKKARGAQKDQLRAMGIGTETWTASRLHAFDGLNEAYRPTSKFERGMESATQGFFLANGQAMITDAAKHMAGAVTMAEIVKHAKRVADGAASEKDINRLASAFIKPEMARRIWKQFDAPGAGEIIDGVYLPNLDRWTDAEARRVFEAAVMREVNIAVITPGQEKPLWMSNSVFGLIGQFKSFTAGANERLVVAQLQRSDAHTLQGLIAILSAGALSVAVGNIAADRPMPERPQDWIKESIEKSGILGWLSEANQLTAKATSGGIDAYRLIGADKPLSSRNASASAMSQLLGPSFGKVEGVFKMTGSAFSEDGWDARAAQDFRRLLPLQNLWALRRGFNEAEDGINRAFGIKPIDRERLTWQ